MRRPRAHRRADWRAHSGNGGKALMPRAISSLGSTGCQPVAFGRCAECILAQSANVNFVAFWRFSPQPQPPIGVMVAIFSIAIAAAEAAVGLALVIAIYRHYRTTNVDQLDQLKG